jgi:hypothetical protein
MRGNPEGIRMSLSGGGAFKAHGDISRGIID